MERPLVKQLMALVMLALSSVGGVAGENVWAGLGVKSTWTDNARRTAQDKITERQDRVNLNIGADYQGSVSKIDADYRVSWNNFSKKTQENDTTMEGQGAIRLGKSGFPLGLDLSHSQRQTLDQQQDDLLENQDQRQISQARPYINLRASKRDNIFISGNYTDVRYRDAKNQNSTSTGSSLVWQHRVTPIDSVGLGVSESDSNFESRNGNGYTYQSAWVNYSSQLRHLSYSLYFGQNKYITDGLKANSRPTYNIDITTDALAQRLNINLSQRFTDTSRGNGNGNSLSLGTPSNSNQEVDIYELRSGQVTWSVQPFCNVCGFNLSGRYERELYETTDQDSLSTQLQASFSYRIKPKTEISIRLRGQDYEYDTDSSKDYRQTGAGIRINRSLAYDLTLIFDFRFDERNFQDSSRNYREHTFGLGINYNYY